MNAPSHGPIAPTDLMLDRARSVVVLVDYQERLMPAVHEHDWVLDRATLLARIARELGVPLVATAQNPSRLGPNVPAVAEHCHTVLDKMSFGACADGLLDRLGSPRHVVIAGCEAHVCLLQTTLPLLNAGHRVWVVSDASGSRRPTEHALAMQRMAQGGATVISVEMAAFEWLRTCEDAAFKAVSALVKG